MKRPTRSQECREGNHKDCSGKIERLNCAGRPQVSYYVCAICGFTTVDGNFARCLVCNNPRERFETVS